MAANISKTGSCRTVTGSEFQTRTPPMKNDAQMFRRWWYIYIYIYIYICIYIYIYYIYFRQINLFLHNLGFIGGTYYFTAIREGDFLTFATDDDPERTLWVQAFYRATGQSDKPVACAMPNPPTIIVTKGEVICSIIVRDKEGCR